jgi:hypothetical protein
LLNTDKYYWHRYLDEYERICFSRLADPKLILEFGVFNGDSIRFLHERFPLSKIIGVDKDLPSKNWPFASHISYQRLDQKDKDQIGDFLCDQGAFDLIIDDGSHDPQHQANCFIEGMKHLVNDGFYIIEDIQTNLSLPGSPLYFLLALEHAMTTRLPLNFDAIGSNYFSQEDMVWLSLDIDTIHIYKRSLLPLTCYACRKDDFDYKKLQCKHCGIDLYDNADSMAAIIRKG